MPGLLTPKLLESLAKLRLHSPHSVHGAYKGESRSKRRGASVEFSEHREYEPGDDFRHIDWNIYHRLDRLFVKLYTEDQNRTLNVLLDTSESMSIGDPSKIEYAKGVAAALTYVALWSGDEARIADAAKRLAWKTPKRRGRHHAGAFFAALEGLRAGGLTDLSNVMHGLASDRRSEGSVTVLISDLFDPSWESAIRALAGVGGSAVLIHVLGPEDLRPRLSGEIRIVDAETGEAINLSIDPDALERFSQSVSRWIDRVRRVALRSGVSYYQADSSVPLETFLLGALRRGGLIR